MSRFVSRGGRLLFPLPRVSTTRPLRCSFASATSHTRRNNERKNVAVVLCGCGAADGSDIREAVLSLLHLDRLSVDATIFAPDVDQSDVVDHGRVKANEDNSMERRNALTEAQRLTADGSAQPLIDLEPMDFDALVVPGGLGVVKTLSDYAYMPAHTGGRVAEAQVDGDMRRVIMGFRRLSRPLGFSGISGLLAGRVLGRERLRITLGEDAADALKMLDGTGAIAVGVPVAKALTDEETLVTTTVAHMKRGARLSEVDQGIGNLIRRIVADIK
jgi:enhancing lycopene biosynthesis protein 2